MKPSDYIEHRRSIFYAKTDEPVNHQRHHLDWAADRKVLRKYSMIENDWAMMAEVRVVEEVAKTGIPVMGLNMFFERGQSYQSMGEAPGSPISELSIEGKRAAWADLGRLLAVLHTIRVGLSGPINPFESGSLMGIHHWWDEYIVIKLDDHVQYALRQDLITEAEAYYIENRINFFAKTWFMAQSNSLLHGDLSDRNVFAALDSVTAIIDWEDAMGGDPVFDLAYWATFHPIEEHKHLLDAYWKYADKPDNFDKRFWAYYLRISLSKLVQLHRYGVPDLTWAMSRIKIGLNHLS